MNTLTLTPKTQFMLLMAFALGVSVLALGSFEPVTRGWWLFQHSEYPLEYFGVLAFIIGSSFVILVTAWYQPDPPGFDLKLALTAFALSGALSMVLCLSVFYPLWSTLGFDDVQTGWWIFSRTESQPRHQVIGLLEITGAIAGPVEELAKLIALLIIPAIRRQLHVVKFALYATLLCAFGFAMIENMAYFANANGLLILRANPAHAVFSAIWGVALGRWFAGQIRLSTFLNYLVFGMALHALWNLTASLSALAFFVVFLLTSWTGLIFIHRALSRPSRLAPQGAA